MACVSEDNESTIALSISDKTLPARVRQRRLNLKPTERNSSSHEVRAECRQIRNEWSCEEEGRRRRLADRMQVSLLDRLTA